MVDLLARRTRLVAVISARWAVLAITLLAAGLRAFQLGTKTLWLDEAFSLWVARHPLPELWSWLVRIDQHPPLYYTLLHFWLIFGDGESALRSLSALAGIATIPIMYGLGSTIGGHRLGLLAAFLLAVSPLHVQFSQEARMYALLTLAATWAMWGLAWLLKKPEKAVQPIGSGWRAWWQARHSAGTWDRTGWVTDVAWLAYVLGTTAALLSHNTAIFLPIAANLAAGVEWWPHRRERSGFLRNWLLAQGIVMLLWSTWLPAFFIQSLMVYREFWIPKPDLLYVLVTMQMLYASFIGPSPLLRPWLDLIVLGVAVIGFWSWRRERRWLTFTLALWLVAPIGELVVSIWRPIFYIRTLIWTSIPLYLAIAAGVVQLGSLTSLPRRITWQRAALIALIAINSGGLGNYYFGFQKEAWDQGAAYVAQRVRPDDLVLFNATWVQIPFDYYFHRYRRPVAEHGVPVDLFDRGLEPKMTREDLPRLEGLAKAYRRVWLVYSHNWYTDPEGLIPATLERLGRLADRREFNGLRIDLYEMKQPSLSGVWNRRIGSMGYVRGAVGHLLP
jgi:4-amino-4-deoxy-L-arabinose transferase-like glycosyltransferase